MAGRKLLCSKTSPDGVCTEADYCLKWIPSASPKCIQLEDPNNRASKEICKEFQAQVFANSQGEQVCEKLGKCSEWIDNGNTTQCTKFEQDSTAAYLLFCVDRSTVINAADGSSSKICNEARWCMTVANVSGPSVCQTWAGQPFQVGHACAKHWAAAEFHRNRAVDFEQQLKLAIDARNIYESDLKIARETNQADLSGHQQALGNLQQRIEALKRAHTFSMAKFHDAAARANKLAVQNAEWKVHSVGLTMMLRQSIGLARFYKHKIKEYRARRARRIQFISLKKNMDTVLKQMQKIFSVQYRLKGSIIRTQMPYTVCKQAKESRDSKLASCQNQDCRTAARAQAAELCRDWQDIKKAEFQLYQKKLDRLKTQGSLISTCSKAHGQARKAQEEFKCHESFSKKCSEVEITVANQCRPFLALSQDREKFLACNRSPADSKETACKPWRELLLALEAADNKTQSIADAIGWASKVRTWGPQCSAAYSTFKTSLNDCNNDVCLATAKTSLENACQIPPSPGSEIKGALVNVEKNKCPLLRGLCQPDCEVFSNGCSSCQCSPTGFVSKHCKKSCPNPTTPRCIKRRNLMEAPQQQQEQSFLEAAAFLDPFSNADPVVAQANSSDAPSYPARPKNIPEECEDALEAEGMTQTKCATEKDARCSSCSDDLKQWRRSVCAVAWIGRNCRWALGLQKFIMDNKCVGLTNQDLQICTDEAAKASNQLCGKAVQDPVGYHRLFTSRRRCQRAQAKEQLLIQQQCSEFTGAGSEERLAACTASVRERITRKCRQFVRALTDQFESELTEAKDVCNKALNKRNDRISNCRTPQAAPGEVLTPAPAQTCELKCSRPALVWPGTCEDTCKSTSSDPNLECLNDCKNDRLEAEENRQDAIDSCSQQCESCVRDAREESKIACGKKETLVARASKMRSAFRQCVNAQKSLDSCNQDAACIATASRVQAENCAVWSAVKTAYYELASATSNKERCANNFIESALNCGPVAASNNTQSSCVDKARSAFEECKVGFYVGTCQPSGNYTVNQCCPTNSVEIRSPEACQEAFDFLSAQGTTPIAGITVTWGGSAEVSPARPSGCIFNKVTSKVQFNGKAPTSSLAGNDLVICQRA